MKTVTFYSYKGGVGRSLALSEIAIRLSELNKKVCVMDFDLDAPGLRFKFKNYNLSKPIEKGIVDYIYEFSALRSNQHKIQDFTVQLQPNNQSSTPINFISAGQIEGSDYWKKLSMIRWADMFYGDRPNGVAFFLDLKSKVEKEIAPDYFLIDSRTGITDISGITLRLLADQVVVLAVNNQENIFGAKKIIKNLLGDGFGGRSVKINFVLSRLPFSSTEIELENKVIDNLREDFERELGISPFQISVIHSDLHIKMKDSYMVHRLTAPSQNTSSKDYLKLFDIITENSLRESELALRIREAENEYSKYETEQRAEQKQEHIDRAILLNPSNYLYFAHRGLLYFRQRKIEAAIEDYEAAMKLNPKDAVLPYNMGHFYEQKGELEKALEYFEMASGYGELAFLAKGQILERLGRIDESIQAVSTAIDVNPMSSKALNRRAHQLRQLGEYHQAFIDISKAIEYDPSHPVHFATLAEIYAAQGKMDEFYLNFSIALSKGLKIEAIRTAKDIYLPLLKDKRFIELLDKYKIFPGSLE